ncbi:hypothetical protein [Novosphingobium colocasiae]|uniref:hypothetical protein n=1 Tax=Novosphingobium colocasiae TaxID=1256513 RepID=UPI00167283AA|nr:hypothetical protein [Novosphingobium colocasiae]
MLPWPCGVDPGRPAAESPPGGQRSPFRYFQATRLQLHNLGVALLHFIRTALVGLVLFVLLGVGVLAFWMTYEGNDPRMSVGDRNNFSRGEYLAFAVPWGGEQGIMRFWAPHADKVRIDLVHFPNNTGFQFSWPPFSPRGGVAGVWGYMGIEHGNYDGAAAEAPVPARRVDDIKVLSQTFAWSRQTRAGTADVLTEFYLRSDPEEPESKLLEIGWFLHIPDKARGYAEKGKPIGSYTDGEGRHWLVVRDEKFVMFLAKDGADVRSGRIDMLAALKWLKQQKVVSGREWYTGVAIGVEPFGGFGRLQIDKWSVDYR